MTDKQIEASKKQLPLHFKDMTVEQRREYEELSCREMINSCLVYGEARYNFYDPNTGEFGIYAQNYIKSLGEDTVVKLFNEQSADFAKAIVKKNVHQDSEGVTYNSVIWEDEQ